MTDGDYSVCILKVDVCKNANDCEAPRGHIQTVTCLRICPDTVVMFLYTDELKKSVMGLTLSDRG